MRQFLWKECMLNDRYWGELRVRALYCVTLVVSYYTLRAGNVWTDPLSIVESLVNVVTMYICLIFFCTLSSYLFLLLFCVVILFIFGSVLCSKCFCLPWFTIMIHSTASVQSAFVSFIWFCLYLLHSEKGAITWLFFNSKHQYWIWYRPLLWSTEWVTEDSKPIVLLTKCMSIIIMNLVLSI